MKSIQCQIFFYWSTLALSYFFTKAALPSFYKFVNERFLQNYDSYKYAITGFGSLSAGMSNAQLQPLKFVQNKFVGDSLILDGYIYRVNNNRNDRVYWSCIVPTCRATVNTHEGNIVKFGPAHNHPATQAKIEIVKIIQTMKDRARKEVTPIPTICYRSFNIVKVLQNTQGHTECTITHYGAGGTWPTKRLRYITMDYRLQQLKIRYQQVIISLIDYDDAASHLLHLG